MYFKVTLFFIKVRNVLANGLVYKDGRIKRGDRIVSVNNQNLSGLENKEALLLLKNSGSTVTFEIARRVGRKSQCPSPFTSQLGSRVDSGEATREPASPVLDTRHPMKPQESNDSEDAFETSLTTGETKTTHKSRSRRESFSRQYMDGEEKGEDEDQLGALGMKERKPATMPRKLGSTVGIKIVELLKGPTGLGMQLKGGSDTNLLPITVKVVFPGGSAHKSGKIHPGDVIIEANNESFENITHKEAIDKLKKLPQGKVSLLVRDRIATAGRASLY